MAKGYFLRRKGLGKGSTDGMSSASSTGIYTIRNDGDIPQDPDLICIRWGCTSTVPQKNVLNTAKSIHEVNDKKGFRIKLGGLAPEMFSTGTKSLSYPLIVRPCKHAQGKHCYLVNSWEELAEACNVCGPDYYISEYIPKVAEYRVFVVQGRAVWVANKIPGNPKDIAWNVAKGGKFENVRWGDWPLDVVAHAIASYQISGLDFGGVDIMVGPDSKCYTLEINSAPSQTSPYRQSCSAKAFDWIMNTGDKTRIPIGSSGKYLKYIHPAIDNKAIIGE